MLGDIVTPDAIETTEVGSKMEGVYDLSGRKIENYKLSNGKLLRGVYIVNGKKVVF